MIKNVYVSSQVFRKVPELMERKKQTNIIQPTLWKLKNLVFLFPSLTYCVSTARVRRQGKYTHIKNRYSISLCGRKAAMSPSLEGVTCSFTQPVWKAAMRGPTGWVGSWALLQCFCRITARTAELQAGAQVDFLFTCFQCPHVDKKETAHNGDQDPFGDSKLEQ